MTFSWTTFADELLVVLEPGSRNKAEQLRVGLRGAIADGRLRPGTRLPSSRTLSSDLGVSRGVVVEAYEQLAAEGWLRSHQGSGTVVADHPSVPHLPAWRPPPQPPVAALDLRPARPDVTSFPRSAWAAATRSVLAELAHSDLSYGDHRGHAKVRQVVADYLGRVRGVRTTPELVVMANGFSSALVSLVATLVGRGEGRIAVEDPGGYEPRRRVVAGGGQVVAVPVDGDGLRVDALERSGADAVLVTPAHQYPMGAVLSAQRRAALADWARRGGWIIEDDYDAEFRYDREPVGAVQAIVPERTIHVGSVAKTLAPTVRVGWLVAPASLIEELVSTHEARASQPATLEQLVLARLIDEGRYDRHLRRVRRRYRERRDVLVEALAAAGLDDRMEGVAAGMQAVVRLADAADDAEVTRVLHDRGVEVVALGRYAIESPARGLVVGFGQATPAELRRAAAVIADVVMDRR